MFHCSPGEVYVNVQEQKIECVIRFVFDHRPDTLSRPYDGVFHLFEHHYRAEFRFWYGVAEIACSQAELFSIVQQGDFADISVQVRFADGRRGRARQIHSSFDYREGAPTTTIAVVGIDSLMS
jgi:hypothetical protein